LSGSRNATIYREVLWIVCAFGAFVSRGTAENAPPFAVAPGLFDVARPGDLGLKPAPGVATFTRTPRKTS
jgi:hypothetical protein